MQRRFVVRRPPLQPTRRYVDDGCSCCCSCKCLIVFLMGVVTVLSAINFLKPNTITYEKALDTFDSLHKEYSFVKTKVDNVWERRDMTEYGFPDIKQQLSNVKIVEKQIEIAGNEIFYLEADTTVEKEKMGRTILLLHGQYYTSSVYRDVTHTMAIFAALGNTVIALDLPGYGKTPKPKRRNYNKGDFINTFVERVVPRRYKNRYPTVIVAPSMSGQFALPALVSRPHNFCGFVPIAPVDTEKYEKKVYKKIKIPTLVLRGENDKSIGVLSSENLKMLPLSTVIQIIPFAKHTAHLDNPDRFHLLLFNFLERIDCP